MSITRKFLNWYAKLSPARGVSAPPYKHVIQIGDPTLRKVSEPVPLDKIGTKHVQTVVKALEYVLKRYASVGMSAPQIGINMRIFVMRHTEQQIKATPTHIVSSRGMKQVPYTVFINPKMKVLDYEKVIATEGCESVRGLSAEVLRYKAVEISGYDAEGVATSEIFEDWAARIAQHELDHLDGKLYTDIMDRKSLCCICWEEVNLSKGQLVIPFTPE